MEGDGYWQNHTGLICWRLFPAECQAKDDAGYESGYSNHDYCLANRRHSFDQKNKTTDENLWN